MTTGLLTVSADARPRVRSTRGKLLALLLLIAVVISWRYADIHLLLLFNRATLGAVTRFLVQSLPPDLSPAFLQVVGRAALMTVATAVASTALSVLLAVPLGMLACSTLWRQGLIATSSGDGVSFRVVAAISVFVRAVLGFLRAVPDLVWALLLVSAIGLGPLAGTLALSISYAGVLGRVYAELFDAVDAQPLEALLSTGAGRTQIFLAGILPQALPNLTAYTLYSFECCVRAAAVLGFVGAGGIGYEISLSMRLFEYRQVFTLLIAFVAILSSTDIVSRRLRGLLNAEKKVRRTSPVHTPRLNPRPIPFRRAWVVGAVLAAVLVSFYLSGLFGLFLDGLETPFEFLRFASRLLPPDLSLNFLQTLWLPLIQTLAISLIGTLSGVVFGGLLSITATSRLVFAPADGPGSRSFLSLAARNAIYRSSRLVLSVLRSIPELVWALICIIAIGIGPFAGTLALGLHTTGVLGKLYADTMEEVAMRPVEALRAIGARPYQVLLWAIWPQTRQLLGSYTVLRWDMNLRAATILGLVGGGGLGQVMYNDVQLGLHAQVATLILVVYALVMATDWAGSRMRIARPA